MNRTSRFNADGFSLVELIIITGIISVLMVGAVMLLPGLLQQSRADASAAAVLNTLRLARDRAIEERRNVQIVFTAPKHIALVRQAIGSETNSTILELDLENNLRFMHTTSMGDTGDTFGLTNKPTAFGTTEGTIPTVMFTSEGSLVDTSGDTLNGTLFVGVAGDPLSARAVTIFGATALLRLWRWDGRKWTE
jgi:Tfp pilus assembly protein FimT